MTEKWIPYLDDDPLYVYEDSSVYSITNNENAHGWRTDSAFEGYGLPLGLAQWICNILNESGKECPYENKGWEWVKKNE